MRYTVISVILAVGVPGCMGITTEQRVELNVSYGYILRKGSAKTITAWALEQSSSAQVVNALEALANIPVFRGGGDPEDAVDGFMQVYQKLLAGWPNLVLGDKDATGGSWDSVREMSWAAWHMTESNAKNYPDKKCVVRLWELVKQRTPTELVPNE